jgi:hypothetical protein
MSTPPSIDELRDLVTQAIALEYLKQKGADTKDKKPRWLQVMETTGFATLVTVLIGGLIGTGVTYMFQTWAKDRELSLAAAQSRRERDLSAFNQHLDRERKTVDEMSQKLGAFVDGASDLAELSRREWNKANRAKDRHEIVRRFNNAASQWHADRVRLSLLLELEHDTDPDLRKDFGVISERADTYARCADRWRTLFTTLSASEAQRACEEFRDKLDAAITAFADRMVVLRANTVKAQVLADHQRGISIRPILLFAAVAVAVILVSWIIYLWSIGAARKQKAIN